MATRYAVACNGYLSYPIFDTIEKAEWEAAMLRKTRGTIDTIEIFILVPAPKDTDYRASDPIMSASDNSLFDNESGDEIATGNIDADYFDG